MSHISHTVVTIVSVVAENYDTIYIEALYGMPICIS